MSRITWRLSATLLMIAIFLVDTLATLEFAVAVLYVLAVLLAARTHRRRDIVVAAAGGIALTIVSYVDVHGLSHVGSMTLRALVSIAAIIMTSVLALQNQRAMQTLRAQAMLLDLSHDMIFVRAQSGAITFWNRTAEEVYGWSSQEAVGRIADELLETRYPDQRESIETALFEAGRWDGILEQRTRSGSTLVLDSRWALQRDHLGRPTGVMETHTDITERRAAYAALVRSEKRYRRMFDASRIGVVQEDWTALRAELETLGLLDEAALESYLVSHPEFVRRARRLTRIEDTNPAFAAMLAANTSSPLPESTGDVLGETDRTFPDALAAFVRGDLFHEGETEIVRSDGVRVPVLFTITFPSEEDADAGVLIFVIDNTERKQAHDALLLAQTELAHATRVATLGELTASIAHEVNQPLMAVVTFGEASIRWLRREPPDLHEAETAIGRIISEGRRAGEIVERVRSFLTKAPAQREELSAASIVEEAVRLVQHELTRERVELRVEIEEPLPPIRGDRVQLQQVLVNLMVNASQAMAEQPGPRLLSICAARAADDSVVITVRDTGPGVPTDHLDRLFCPFFTTKQKGMGMGLAICKTIAEAHGGRLSVESEPGRGATFRLALAVA
jgi:PAS domain S-box-containing protein